MKHDYSTPRLKFYEALGAVADGRVLITAGGAEVKSSSGNKSYQVEFDSKTREISSNDNGSYWKGYIGYPMIAFLLVSGELKCDWATAESLKGIPWKEINTRTGNDYLKSMTFVERHVAEIGGDHAQIESQVSRLVEALSCLELVPKRSAQNPPSEY